MEPMLSEKVSGINFLYFWMLHLEEEHFKIFQISDYKKFLCIMIIIIFVKECILSWKLSTLEELSTEPEFWLQYW